MIVRNKFSLAPQVSISLCFTLNIVIRFVSSFVICAILNCHLTWRHSPSASRSFLDVHLNKHHWGEFRFSVDFGRHPFQAKSREKWEREIALDGRKNMTDALVNKRDWNILQVLLDLCDAVSRSVSMNSRGSSTFKYILRHIPTWVNCLSNSWSSIDDYRLCLFSIFFVVMGFKRN